MRAGLVFVLVSLLLGSSIREWGRAHETRLRDLVDRLTAAEDAQPGGSGGAGGAPPESTVAPEARPAHSGTDRMGSAVRPAALDPDRATAAEWERLPGIGPTLARRIVADRAARGPFRSGDGLLRVRGIGPKTLERIRSYLLPPAAPAPPESLTAN
jgi:competence ComEA-like helix-hairpin-helix protein